MRLPDEQRHHAIFGASPLPTWISEERTDRFVYVNDAALRQYGYTRAEFLTRTSATLRPYGARTRRSDRPATSELVATESIADRQHRRMDGSVFAVELQVAPMRVAGVTLLLTVSVANEGAERSAEVSVAARELVHDLVTSGSRPIAVEDLDQQRVVRRRALRGGVDASSPCAASRRLSW